MRHAPIGSEIPVIAMTGITKEYPSVTALNDVSLVLRRGEVHATRRRPSGHVNDGRFVIAL